jgi:hypothetical protein
LNSATGLQTNSRRISHEPLHHSKKHKQQQQSGIWVGEYSVLDQDFGIVAGSLIGAGAIKVPDWELSNISHLEVDDLAVKQDNSLFSKRKHEYQKGGASGKKRNGITQYYVRL